MSTDGGSDLGKGIGTNVQTAPRRVPEAVRNTLDLFRSCLLSLAPEHRAEVLSALGVESEAKLVAMTIDRDEWKAHNEQRLEQVWAARKLLDAQPNETLTMAVERALKNRT